MSEKESDVRSTNFLKEETREAWDNWVILAEPHASSKGFWRAFDVLSTNLAVSPATSYMEGDHVMMIGADGITETVATDAQKRAYKADAMAQNYLMLSLKNMPELQRETKGSCKTAFAMFSYLQAKFRLRDPTRLYAELQGDLDKLNPNDYEDGYKFTNKASLINSNIQSAIAGNELSKS